MPVCVLAECAPSPCGGGGGGGGGGGCSPPRAEATRRRGRRGEAPRRDCGAESLSLSPAAAAAEAALSCRRYSRSLRRRRPPPLLPTLPPRWRAGGRRLPRGTVPVGGKGGEKGVIEGGRGGTACWMSRVKMERGVDAHRSVFAGALETRLDGQSIMCSNFCDKILVHLVVVY
jgi:hypothetical protein